MELTTKETRELIKVLEPTIQQQNETIKNIYSKLIIKLIKWQKQ